LPACWEWPEALAKRTIYYVVIGNSGYHNLHVSPRTPNRARRSPESVTFEYGDAEEYGFLRRGHRRRDCRLLHRRRGRGSRFAERIDLGLAWLAAALAFVGAVTLIVSGSPSTTASARHGAPPQHRTGT
jgi:hypothetical protein